MSKNNILKLNVANDLGYGSVKAKVEDTNIHFPSVIAIQREQDLNKPVEFNSNQEKLTYLEGMINHMDVTISSSAVKTQGRFLVGNAAIKSSLPLKAFDVNDFTGKSDNDLAIILTLSMIAAQRISLAVKNGEDLSDQLSTEINMTTALPVSEGKKNGIINNYVNKYIGSKHTVVFHNFKDPITVSLSFKNVYVALEGEVAQLYLKNSDIKLQGLIKQDFSKNYPELANDIKVSDLVKIDNLLGIDIGEGTTDLVVIKEGHANAVASTSLPTGYGNALQDAIDVLQTENMNFEARSQLQDYLAQEVSLLAKRMQTKVRQIVFEQLEPFADKIVTAASKTMRKAGANVEILYVYGGGSIPMLEQTALRQKLSQKMKDFSGGIDVPVIWINKSYAQNLNEKGLELILKAMNK
ncbi:ParM/StbA family protein [Lactobacillus salivarius]|uniref:ParM/StbA family protein n=1 Tax=Ligilactobacillus salivarius TaxID=1624 RepID=A0A5C8H8L2_9LACO|nr:ParM/StbA family protein [Ligilactobacillus salivarius]MBX0283840.1 ParM/StbA family protein [Ligilactobacillus salivarius]MYY45226.1 ParM/StbA family protein [Ligilactobacillus salivarius]MYY50712.1 ParM/StbA family protein [Ligilactobacillus salivarius]MYY74926.1 ParM/StbA family protein [Ligilactobacillus salivarius]MYZ66111.1 ParM/StbA family protein [Ligilactobacillus salivarius]